MTETNNPAPSALDVLTLRWTADRVATKEAYEAWEIASAAYLASVEALPTTPDNLAARVRALRVCYGDNVDALDEMLAGEQTTDARLVRQIIMTLIRAG